MICSSKSDENSEEDLFYFESDHLALKGNQDYSEVLKTLFILKAQRERAIKDYGKVVEIKKKALENPLEVVEKLKNGIDLGIPPLLSLPEIPKINFAKYDVKIPEDCVKQVYASEHDQEFKEERVDKNDRKHDNLNSTHNKPWSIEEQKKLEALLRTYPPEAVEAKRFEKIAAALGTRTTKQVTSRVQKYFLKLRQSGLPIPGRIPKNDKYPRKTTHKHQRHNHYLSKPTTFFPHLSTPVTMNELDEPPVPISNVSESSGKPASSNYLLPLPYQESNLTSPSVASSVAQRSDMEAQMSLLKRIKQEKLRECDAFSNQYVHTGFRCDYCNEDPIVGGRWHCSDCKADSIDFCTDCILAQLYSENVHPVTHRIMLYHNETETSLSLSDSESNACSGKEYSCKEEDESCDSETDTGKDVNTKSDTDIQKISGSNSHSPVAQYTEHLVQNRKAMLDPNRTHDFFSDTQIVSYNYLHSTMCLEEQSQ